ncbi:DUF6341 family protein [Aequorivita echinoideorum]|uniref:Uracil phosphoribosyltransferase n=1 Tax=Aequorivita echinoideorum TaxID=1549647 RepID=A0ABS5S1T6_9FLAO|nr:uracil phosphoribosyltransferase [Aequorivita echinoideorum]MBT0607171.1 uracil phosphoribosyltransferase [Aequorivita echinoideorum]
MTWQDIWEGIASLFENTLFLPLDFFRMTVDSWWLANIISWIFILIFAYLFIYWLRVLKVFHDNNEDEVQSAESRWTLRD